MTTRFLGLEDAFELNLSSALWEPLSMKSAIYKFDWLKAILPRSFFKLLLPLPCLSFHLLLFIPSALFVSPFYKNKRKTQENKKYFEKHWNENKKKIKFQKPIRNKSRRQKDDDKRFFKRLRTILRTTFICLFSF